MANNRHWFLLLLIAYYYIAFLHIPPIYIMVYVFHRLILFSHILKIKPLNIG